MASKFVCRVIVVVVAVELLAAGCSGTHVTADSAGTEDRDAGLVARDYVRAIADGRTISKARLDDAYSMLLPGQRSSISRGLYTDCILQDDTQGNTPTTDVRKVNDDGSVVPPGYAKALPTKTVFMTLPAEYSRAAEYYGKLRVAKDGGRWYVSVAASAFKNYGEGSCEYSIWEYPEPSTDPAPPPLPAPKPAG